MHNLIIAKRIGYENRYENVCLILDDNELDQICTDKSGGLSDQKSNSFITWRYEKPKLIQKVSLHFRDTSSDKGWAQIADLKIEYETISTGNSVF